MNRKRTISLLAALLVGVVVAGTGGSGANAATPAPGAANGTVASAITGAPSSTTSISGHTYRDGSTVFATGDTQLTVLPAAGPEPSDAQLQLSAPSITCNLNVQYVHGSTHVSGTINGVAVVTCTGGPAGSLLLHYSLIRVSPNPNQWAADDTSNVGASSLQNNRAVPCSEGPGDFRGWAMGVITPPPGYQLTGPAENKKYGAIQPVACGLSLAFASSAPVLAESTSVTFTRSDLVK